MATCSINGIKIYYEVSGDGSPLALIHANPFDRRLWIYQVAHFSTFFKVIDEAVMEFFKKHGFIPQN